MSTSDRPTAPAPLSENIPAELKARAQWVLWRYEWVVNKQGIGKWTKVPYGARDVKAATNRPTSWQSFASALDRYHANRDYFDGIGYVFAEDDPYVGGDVDNDLSLERIPPTYAETSPSGKGTKFIARASGAYGRKTARGELYSSKRFFTITGRVVAGHEHITECQAAVEAFAASLGGKERKARTGSGCGDGSRAQIAADIPEAEWAEGRRLLRTEIHRLLGRVRAAAGRDTLLALLLGGEYARAYAKYPGKNLYRGDGSVDASNVRFWTGQGIYGRGFTFAQYIAIMSHLYAADALAKWGTKELWRQELAAMWHEYPNYTAYTPRAYTPRTVPKVKRGRAGNHADLVERVYQLLIDHKAGAEAIVTAGAIGDVIYCHRRTVMTILNELRAAGRIATRRLPRHGGLVITFLDVIYSDQPAAVSPQPHAPNDAPPAPTEETTDVARCVSSECAVDHTLHEAILVALDALPGKRLNERTGELKAWPRSTKRICAYLAEHYPHRWRMWQRAAPYAIASVRKQQRHARFAELRDMSAKALAKELDSVSQTIGRFDRQATEAATPEIAGWCQTQASKRRGRLAMLAAERADRDEREARRLAQFGYSQVEQAEMLADVERTRDPLAWRPGRAVKVEPDHPTEGTPTSLLSSLFQRKAAHAAGGD